LKLRIVPESRLSWRVPRTTAGMVMINVSCASLLHHHPLPVHSIYFPSYFDDGSDSAFSKETPVLNSIVMALSLAKAGVTGIGIPAVEPVFNGVYELAQMLLVRTHHLDTKP
jgi:hypothetical protein